MGSLSGAASRPQLAGGIPAVTAALSALSESHGPQTPHIADQHLEDDNVVLQINSARNQLSTANEDDQRARVIARLTEENPATVAEIIQIWLNEAKKG